MLSAQFRSIPARRTAAALVQYRPNALRQRYRRNGCNFSPKVLPQLFTCNFS